MSSEWSPPFTLTIRHFPHALYMLRPSHPPRFDNEATHCEIFCSPFLFYPAKTQILMSTHFSNIQSTTCP
jgi:hypothetical protein